MGKKEFYTMEEVLAGWEEEDKKKNLRNWLNKRFPSGYAGYNIYHILTHPWLVIEEWMLQIKWAWQRAFRGWDDQAIWSIDGYLSKLIPELVGRLRVIKHGIPIDCFDGLDHDENYCYSEESEKIASERWNKILDEIVEGFVLYLKDDFYKNEEYQEKFNKSFDMLKKYFGNLWD